MKRGITKDQILQAADKWAEAGQTVSVRAVRAITGGATETVAAAVREWHLKNGTSGKGPSCTPAPDSAASEVADLRKRLADEIAENKVLRAHAADMDAENCELRTENAAKTDKITSLEDEIQNMQILRMRRSPPPCPAG